MADEMVNYESQQEELTPRWVLGKLVCSIIAIILSVVIGFQSIAAGLISSLSGSNDVSGGFGFLTAGVFLVCGIVGLVTRKAVNKAPSIVVCVFYWGAFFFSRIGAGIFADLEIWGYVAYAFGCLFLFSVCRTKKAWIVSVLVSLVYLFLGLA